MTSPYRMNQAAKVRFADVVLERLASAPFGTIPKRELDQALFDALVAADAVSVQAPVFDTARQLGVTPARVRSLVYAHRLARAGLAQDVEIMLDRVVIVSLDPEGDAVVNIEDAYDRDVFLSVLKRHGVYGDTSHNRERIILPAKKFLDVVERAFGEAAGELGEQAEELRKAASQGRLSKAILKGVGKASEQVMSLTLRVLFTQAGVL